jgi:anthranilate/para-aminobenzoate synthase component II
VPAPEVCLVSWPLHGVRFHPESFLTAEEPKLLKNFVEMK